MTGCLNLSRINFHSFSSSENWIGYFQWRGSAKIGEVKDTSNYSEELVHKAALLVFNYFKSSWSDFFLLSALSYDDNDRFSDKEYMATVNNLYGDIYEEGKKRGLLLPYTDEYDKWFNHDWYNLEQSQIPLEFLRFCFDSDFILPFSEMAMAMVFNKVVGQQCFLINPQLQIVLYPHEDTGYGCIDLGNNPNILVDFLKYCDKSEDFCSYVEPKFSS